MRNRISSVERVGPWVPLGVGMLDGDGTAPPLSNLVSSAPDLRCWPHHHRPGSRSSRRSNLHGSKRSAPYTAAKSISPYNINGCNSRQMSAGTSEGGLLALHELRQAKLVVNRDTCRSDWRWHTSVCVLALELRISSGMDSNRVACPANAPNLLPLCLLCCILTGS